MLHNAQKLVGFGDVGQRDAGAQQFNLHRPVSQPFAHLPLPLPAAAHLVEPHALGGAHAQQPVGHHKPVGGDNVPPTQPVQQLTHRHNNAYEAENNAQSRQQVR